MQCGAKCFLVEVERDGRVEQVQVTARSSVAARKTVRVQFDDIARIVSVREDKKA